MTREEARDFLLSALEDEVREDAMSSYAGWKPKRGKTADGRAQKIITNTAIQRWASDQVSESSVSVVPLPSEEMKGRIIGREGRNIRALEMATGVDLIIDDTPEAVLLSGFDPRAERSLAWLVSKSALDGDASGSIEEMVERVRLEVDTMIREEGERAAFEASVPGLNPDLVKALGRLHFRYSMGQNVLKHSVEVARTLCGMMASELGADVNVARKSRLASRHWKRCISRGRRPTCSDWSRHCQAVGSGQSGGTCHCRSPLRRRASYGGSIPGSGR